MTWRDRLRALRDRVGVDADLDRASWAYAWLGWLLTLAAFPLALSGEPLLVLPAYGILVGLWVGGALLSLRLHGELQVIRDD